jgi:putative toxin-antitoxin system antitoxin component (TIGR02293 family)
MPKNRKTLKSASHQMTVREGAHVGKRVFVEGDVLKNTGVSCKVCDVTIGNVRRGLSTQVFKNMAASLGFSDREFAGVLKIPNRTLDRRFKHEVLSPDESDRLARVANILKRAQEVFGSVEKARDWMNTPLSAFEGETPLQRADTSIGANQVEDVLGRIDYGVYS